MACLDEFTCSVYADGELPELEARAVEQHLEECAECSGLVHAMRVESRVLVQCLQGLQDVEADEHEHVNERNGGRVVILGIQLIGVAAMVRMAFGALGSFELPAYVDWLGSVPLNLLIGAVTYVVFEGGSMLESFVSAATLVSVNLIVLAGIAMLLRRSIGTNLVLSLIALLAVFSTPSYALDVRSGGETVRVAAGETIDDTLVVFGGTVSIDGTVNGDVIAFARIVTVRGTVRGNVISIAQRTVTEGTVEGSVIGIGQSVQTRGQVDHNVYGFGQQVRTESPARIAGNAALIGQEISVDGNVERDVWVFGGRGDIQGNIARNLVAYAGAVTVLASAHVGGNLSALVPSTDMVQVESGATIDGATDIRIPEPRPSRYATLSFYIWRAIWFAGAFLSGWILFSLFPSLTRLNLDTGRNLLVTAGVGFLALCATPIAAVIIGITMIGLPIGLAALALWIMGLYLAKIVIAVFLGRALLASEGGQRPLALTLLVGLALILVAVNLPLVGPIINLLLSTLGLGALLLALYRNRPSALAT